MATGLSATEIVNYIFADGSLVYQLAGTVRDVALVSIAGLSLIGFLFFFVRLILYRESYSFSDLLRIVIIPAVAIAMLTPTSDFRGGIALWIAEQIFKAGAYITDKITVGAGFAGSVLTGKTEMSGTPSINNNNVMFYYNSDKKGTVKFTELASDFKDMAEKNVAMFRESMKNSLNQDIAEPSDLGHTNWIGGGLAFLIGLGSGISDSLSSFGSGNVIGGFFKALTTPVAGAKTLGIYFLIKWIMGNAVDVIWRLAVILWVIKVSAVVIAFPIAVLVIALAFDWGLQNLSKVLLNVIGIAITPVVMVGIFIGGVVAYGLISPIIDGLGFGIGLLTRLFFDIAYPVIVAGALLRSGEIVSYIIGVSSFAIASLGAEYVRPQRIAYDAMPLK